MSNDRGDLFWCFIILVPTICGFIAQCHYKDDCEKRGGEYYFDSIKCVVGEELPLGSEE
jgi:hypothetical protein